MADESVYGALGKLTEEMYLSLAKSQSSRMQDQLISYHELCGKKIAEMITAINNCNCGEMMSEYKKKLQILHDDFCYMKSDIGSKYKLYLRGCGNAGKSTLLNALLMLDEAVGSRMGRLPMTFIIDIYTDELPVKEAEVRSIASDGSGKYSRMSRAKAIRMEDEEEKKFSASRDICRAEIEKRCKGVYLEQERADIERDVYLGKLLRTRIREIKWGIGKNEFFHNCVLIDTPGLNQELRFTNVIEDVKNYEVDGILWVISSESLQKQEVIDAYREEMKEMQDIYNGKRVIAVINMYGEGEDYFYGSRLWQRVEKKARKIYCGQCGFHELVCVNAKLAYEGNLRNCEEDIARSNISGLRAAINGMFVERSTEAYHQEKLNKIDSFLDNLYRDTEEAGQKLQKRAEEYEDKKNKIMSQATACRGLVNSAANQAVNRHLGEIRSRIYKNSESVQEFHAWDRSLRDSFIRDVIVQPDIIEEDISEALEESAEKVYDRFRNQQVHSIISGFNTTDYALRHFRKENTDVIINQRKEPPSFRYQMSNWEAVGEMVTNFIGNNMLSRAIGSILVGVRNAIRAPQDRLYDSIERELDRWAEESNLNDVIRKYEEMCMETLDKSMAQTCGEYGDVKGLIGELDLFNSGKPHMVWEKVGLEELIGGWTDE